MLESLGTTMVLSMHCTPSISSISELTSSEMTNTEKRINGKLDY